MRSKLLSSCIIVTLTLSSLSPALADPPHNKGKGRGHLKQGVNRTYNHIEILGSDRVIIREYLSDHYAGSCPPGLAKKHNGCLPPGQAKKYSIGQPLPNGIIYTPVPHDLLVRLRPVPAGYHYVMVDRDVLLIGEATKKVIDAITLLSAVN